MVLLELQNTINMGRLRKPLPPQTIARLPGPASHTAHLQVILSANPLLPHLNVLNIIF